jgi:hypothetical protein
VKRIFGIMPPKRCRERSVVNAAMEEETRQLCARLESMETTQRRAPKFGDLIKTENEYVEVEEVVGEQEAKGKYLRVVVKMGTREKIEVMIYEGDLNVEELLDWISDLDKYFYYEEIDDEKKVKHAVTRLKGHAYLWWD